MISFSLAKAIAYAKEHKIPRVIEIKCPRKSCGKILYAFTDDDKHEHAAWLAEFKRQRFQRKIFCKHCGYGVTSDHEGDFIMETHELTGD